MFGMQGIGFANPSEIIAKIIEIIGPDGGLFVYNGTPALGNPPVYYITAPGTSEDPENNPVQSGAVVDSDLPMLIYSSNPAAANTLLVSIIPGAANYTDEYGNVALPGNTQYGYDGILYSAVNLNAAGEEGSGVAWFYSNTGMNNWVTGPAIEMDDDGNLYFITSGTPGAAQFLGDFIGLPAPLDEPTTAALLDESALYDWNGYSKSVSAADGNHYDLSRLTQIPSQAYDIDSTAYTNILGPLNLAVGTYHLRGQIVYQPAESAGEAYFNLAASGGLVIASNGMHIEFQEVAINTTTPSDVVFGFGSDMTGTGAGNKFTGSTFGGSLRVCNFDGTFTVETAGELSFAASCSAAADTYTVRQQGTYWELFPITT